jgi:hypothetical protein
MTQHEFETFERDGRPWLRHTATGRELPVVRGGDGPTDEDPTGGADPDAPLEVEPIEIPEVVASYGELGERDQIEFLSALFPTEGETVVDDTLLQGLHDDVAAEIRGLNANRTPDNVDRMRRLNDYRQVIEAEQSRRSEAMAGNNSDADDIMAALGDEPGGTELDGAEGGDVLGGDDAADPDGGEGGGAQEPAGVGVGAGAEGGDGGGDGDAGFSTEGIRPPRRSGAALAAELQRRQDRKAATGTTMRREGDNGAIATLPAPAGSSPQLAAQQRALELAQNLLGLSETPFGFTALKEARTDWFDDTANLSVDAPISLDQLTEVIVAKHQSLRGNHGGVSQDKLRLARAKVDFGDRMLHEGAAVHNFGVMDKLFENVQTITASGGNCALATPRYEINQYATPQSPVEDNLPVVGAPRGAMTWVKTLDFSTLRSGISITTDTQDRNTHGFGSGSGQTPFKATVKVTCPSPVSAVVVAVSSTIQFGNLTHETWPEFVAARLKDLAANFASVKEVLYLNTIDADATLSQQTAIYGAYRALMRHVDSAAWNYRKQQNMDTDARLDWYAPNWLIPALRQDIIEDFSNGTLTAISEQEITGRFQALGLNVIWYYDSATGEGQAFSGKIPAQVGSADNAVNFPADAVWFLEAPGTHVRLDTGVLDLGIVRDHLLNQTNDLQMFMEQFLTVVMFGALTIKGVTKAICVNGGAPAGMTVHTC